MAIKFAEHKNKDMNDKDRKSKMKKFFIVVLILLFYFIFASLHFGIRDGFAVMLLTWSFFVLATPVPDGGIILDLPLRYFTGIKMITAEVFVWVFAIFLNVFFFIFDRGIYDDTILLTVFQDIFVEPFPYGLIIILSGIGTFTSLYYGDELYDALSRRHNSKHSRKEIVMKIVILVGIVGFVILLYKILLNHLGISF